MARTRHPYNVCNAPNKFVIFPTPFNEIYQSLPGLALDIAGNIPPIAGAADDEGAGVRASERYAKKNKKTSEMIGVIYWVFISGKLKTYKINYKTYSLSK